MLYTMLLADSKEELGFLWVEDSMDYIIDHLKMFLSQTYYVPYF